MANFQKGTWKLGENIRYVVDGEIITNIKATLPTLLTTPTAKKISQDYECTWKWCTGFIFFSFSFLGAGLLKSLHGHSCVHQLHSAAIIRCKQARMREWRFKVFNFLFLSNWGWCPPRVLVSYADCYSAYMERRYCTADNKWLNVKVIIRGIQFFLLFFDRAAWNLISIVTKKKKNSSKPILTSWSAETT